MKQPTGKNVQPARAHGPLRIQNDIGPYERRGVIVLKVYRPPEVPRWRARALLRN